MWAQDPDSDVSVPVPAPDTPLSTYTCTLIHIVMLHYAHGGKYKEDYCLFKEIFHDRV